MNLTQVPAVERVVTRMCSTPALRIIPITSSAVCLAVCERQKSPQHTLARAKKMLSSVSLAIAAALCGALSTAPLRAPAHRAARALVPACELDDDGDVEIPSSLGDFDGLLKMPRLMRPEAASYEGFRERRRAAAEKYRAERGLSMQEIDEKRAEAVKKETSTELHRRGDYTFYDGDDSMGA